MQLHHMPPLSSHNVQKFIICHSFLKGKTLDTLEVLRLDMLKEMEKTDKDSIDVSG